MSSEILSKSVLRGYAIQFRGNEVLKRLFVEIKKPDIRLLIESKDFLMDSTFLFYNQNTLQNKVFVEKFYLYYTFDPKNDPNLLEVKFVQEGTDWEHKDRLYAKNIDFINVLVDPLSPTIPSMIFIHSNQNAIFNVIPKKIYCIYG